MGNKLFRDAEVTEDDLLSIDSESYINDVQVTNLTAKKGSQTAPNGELKELSRKLDVLCSRMDRAEKQLKRNEESMRRSAKRLSNLASEARKEGKKLETLMSIVDSDVDADEKLQKSGKKTSVDKKKPIKKIKKVNKSPGKLSTQSNSRRRQNTEDRKI